MIEQPLRYLFIAFLISFVVIIIGSLVLTSLDNCTDDGCYEFYISKKIIKPISISDTFVI